MNIILSSGDTMNPYIKLTKDINPVMMRNIIKMQETLKKIPEKVGLF